MTEIPDISSLTSLTSLDLSFNHVKAFNVAHFPPELKKLNLANNKLESENIEFPTHLKKLNLANNTKLVSIVSFPSQLASLNLDSTRLGFPPRSCYEKEKQPLKGAALKKLLVWMKENAMTPVHRLYYSQSQKVFVDITVGTATDAIVDKPNEDRVTSFFSLYPNSPYKQSVMVRAVSSCFFSLFDGHLGSYVAENASSLVMKLKKAGLFADTKDPVGDVPILISNAIQELDKELCDVLQKEKMKDGATCVVAYVNRTAVLTVAWLGDSRAVLVRKDGSFAVLTNDHKPDDPKEKEYILKHGGSVQQRRVNGILAMSRSLGDVRLKRPKKVVSSIPEIHVRQLTPQDACLIIASDGLWDVCSNDLAAITAAEANTADRGAESLVKLAKSNNSWDNASVTCVRFDWSELGE